MSKRLRVYVLILTLFFQFVLFFRTGIVYGEDRITSYASLDLKDLDPNYANEIVGKTFISFNYLINETFRISLLVETDDPDRPEVLIHFYPDDTGEKEYKSRYIYKVPLSNLKTDKNDISVLGLYINDKISDLNIISVSRIGIRGSDCYIGFIQLMDPDTFDIYRISIDPNPNIHIFDQGWASNNSPESFEVTMKVKDRPFTNPYIYIKGEKVGAHVAPTSDSQADTSDGESDGELQYVYNPYLFPGGWYPVRLSNESDNETDYYYGQSVNLNTGLGLYAGQYGGYSGLYGMYGGSTYGSQGLYGGIYGGLGMYGGLGLYGGSLYGMYGGIYGSQGLYGGVYGGLLGMYGGPGILGAGLYGMYGGLAGSLGLYGGLFSGLGGYPNPNDILIAVALLQDPDLVLPLPGGISLNFPDEYRSFSSF